MSTHNMFWLRFKYNKLNTPPNNGDVIEVALVMRRPVLGV